MPSKCSSVLLPEPLWPMIDRNSPRRNFEVDAAEDGNLDLSFAVALVQAHGGQLQRPRGGLRMTARRHEQPCAGMPSVRAADDRSWSADV